MVKASRRLLAKTAVRLAGKPDLAKALASYLVATKRKNQAELLVKDIARELFAEQGVLEAEVQTALGLDDASRKQLIAYLRQATGARQVELSETIKPELLSGVVIRTADQELDLSARRKLRQLANVTTGGY
ncbi:MAG TPA: F0F1 ATP synthase subunit delta [Candidatus Acidoferrum sp.]|nr:F0F1 ATP synthase subunit delta [Candidatus Acidoferrum sp.]